MFELFGLLYKYLINQSIQVTIRIQKFKKVPTLIKTKISSLLNYVRLYKWQIYNCQFLFIGMSYYTLKNNTSPYFIVLKYKKHWFVDDPLSKNFWLIRDGGEWNC